MFSCFKKQKKKVKINLHPSNAAPVQFTKAISLEPRKKKGVSYHESYGFISNVMGTGDPGILIHGTGWEVLGVSTRFSFIKPGRNVPPIVGIESPDRLFQIILDVCRINLKRYNRNRPFHLITCFGNAETSMAQKLADFLNRPVISYGSAEGELIYTGIVDEIGGIHAVLGNKGRGNIFVKLGGKYIPAAQRFYAPAKAKKETMRTMLFTLS